MSATEVFHKLTARMQRGGNAHTCTCNVGDVIEFGRYPQGSNGEVQPIRWNVLALEESTALLITEDCLMMSGYCDQEKAYGNPWYLVWGNSLAREMCNGVFYYQAFTQEEQAVIEPKLIAEATNGPRCTDEVFLLSEREVALFMGDQKDRRATLSPLLRQPKTKPGAFLWHGYTSWWLLPEEEGQSIYPKAVCPDGTIQYHGRNIYHWDFAIRPCIMIDLDRFHAYAEKLPDCAAAAHSDPVEEAHGPGADTSGGSAYSLAYIKGYEGAPRENRPGARVARHDVVGHTWRLTVQLDAQRIWFLSVFVRDDGTFDKFSLDQETASDSHYEFRDEAGLRAKIHCPGDEEKYLAEVLIRYVQTYGGNALLSALHPFITAQYHFD